MLYQLSYASRLSTPRAVGTGRPCRADFDFSGPRGTTQGQAGSRLARLRPPSRPALPPVAPVSGRDAARRRSSVGGPPRHHTRSRSEGRGAPRRRAGDGTRTRDIKLGRLALYQLSYSRVSCIVRVDPKATDGGGRIRTFEGLRRQIYSLIPLATWVPHRSADDPPALPAFKLTTGIEPVTA